MSPASLKQVGQEPRAPDTIHLSGAQSTRTSRFRCLPKGDNLDIQLSEKF